MLLDHAVAFVAGAALAASFVLYRKRSQKTPPTPITIQDAAVVLAAGVAFALIAALARKHMALKLPKGEPISMEGLDLPAKAPEGIVNV